MIAFIGSVFSPYYAWSGRGDPLDHCAVNVALYGPRGRRWAMTERGRRHVTRDAARLAIGPSSLTWEGGALVLAIDEITSPTPSRLRGEIRLHPGAIGRQGFDLSGDARHLWRPVAPRAEVEVRFERPAVSWRGEGYFDTNCGEEPLEARFEGWEWSRAHLGDETRLYYDVVDRRGGRRGLALRYGPGGGAEPIEPPPPLAIATTPWGMRRRPRIDGAGPPARVRTLEDSPFYARTALRAGSGGAAAEIVHESLSLARLRSPLVRAILPVRMPRVPW